MDAARRSPQYAQPRRFLHITCFIKSIDNSSPDPIYDQIANQIKGQIIGGALAEGKGAPINAQARPRAGNQRHHDKAVSEARMPGIGTTEFMEMLQVLCKEEE
jgi:hypothetical protein